MTQDLDRKAALAAALRANLRRRKGAAAPPGPAPVKPPRAPPPRED